jgi:flavorubredoxin
MRNIELYRNSDHLCVLLNESESEEEGGIHSNQYLILHRGEGILLDPGGFGVMPDVLEAMLDYCQPEQIKTIFLSHQDPDIVGGLASWLEITPAKIWISRLWVRFIPHYGLPAAYAERLVPIPDEGATLTLSDGVTMELLPAHFLHSEGNFHLYDPIARGLFSGDLGAAEVRSDAALTPYVNDFSAHLRHIEGFHRRYMGGHQAIAAWLETIAGRAIDFVAPQHGPIYRGQAVADLLAWLSHLRCGVDLLQPGGRFLS